MYTHNRTGTKHKIDPSFNLIGVSGQVTETAHDQPLKVRLDTANLGSKQQAYTSVRYLNAGSIKSEKVTAFGVALTPMQTFALDRNQPLYVELTIAMQFAPYHQGDIGVSAFLGYQDNDGGLTDGFGDNNTVTNYHLIPSLRSDSGAIYVREAVLLQNINSAAFNFSRPLILGFNITNPTNNEKGLFNIIYSISARYARQKIVTQDMTR